MNRHRSSERRLKAVNVELSHDLVSEGNDLGALTRGQLGCPHAALSVTRLLASAGVVGRSRRIGVLGEVEPGGDPSDRRILHKGLQRDSLPVLPQQIANGQRRQGIPSTHEEVVVDADLGNAQDRFPNGGNPALRR